MQLFTRIGITCVTACVLALSLSTASRAADQTISSHAPAASVDDRGTLAISFGGHPIGTEQFSIRSSGDKIDAEAEIQLRTDQGPFAKAVKTSSHLVLDPKLDPLTYVATQKGSEEFHLEVDFRKSPAASRLHLAGQKEDDLRDFALPKDVVILDNNVLHHYQLLVYRFAQNPAKQQTFQAYVPQDALPGMVTVEEIGTENVDLGGHTASLRHLIVSTEIVRIDLWVDAQQHLQRLYNSALQLDAVRKD